MSEGQTKTFTIPDLSHPRSQFWGIYNRWIGVAGTYFLREDYYDLATDLTLDLSHNLST